MAKKFKSDAFEAIHSAVAGMHKAGTVSKSTMRHFDETCLDTPEELGQGNKGIARKLQRESACIRSIPQHQRKHSRKMGVRSNASTRCGSEDFYPSQKNTGWKCLPKAVAVRFGEGPIESVKKHSPKQDPDLMHVAEALARANKRARKLAEQTGTEFVVNS